MKKRNNPLNPYKIMWITVMFDLPTGSKKERKSYSEFRKSLLDSGFEMCQYSVYMRFCVSREACEKYVRLIKKNAPDDGDISILFFTDKQFSQIINIKKREFIKPPEPPEQLFLF